MMDDIPRAVQTIHAHLELYVKSREEAVHIRQALAASLAGFFADGQLPSPLSRVDSELQSSSLRGSRSLHHRYLKAVEANFQAKKSFGEERQIIGQRAQPREEETRDTSKTLLDHIASIKLQQRQAKLSTLHEYLDALSNKPAASVGFMETSQIFQDSRPLPTVPQEIINGLADDPGSDKTDVSDLARQLEKTVLRAKLLLRREERLLEDVKAVMSPDSPFDEDAKLHALDTARNNLIGWIELELSHASEDGEESTNSERQHDWNTTDKADIKGKLSVTKEKYARYLAARKALLSAATISPVAPSLPMPTSESRETDTGLAQPSLGYLFLPYLQELLSLRREQKDLLLQKSHLSVALAKQFKDTGQIVDHLTQESQLLPRFDTSRTRKPKLGYGDELGTVEQADLSGRVQPWITAADSAKIATLEAVAENIEQGQGALESSTKAVDGIHHLLGKKAATSDSKDNDAAEGDIWLASAPQSARRAETRKAAERLKPSVSRDVWSLLNGKLGLIGHEEPV